MTKTEKKAVLRLLSESHDKEFTRQLLQNHLETANIDLNQVLKTRSKLPLVWMQKSPNEERDAFQLDVLCIGAHRQRFFKNFYEFCCHIGSARIKTDPISSLAVDFTTLENASFSRLIFCKVSLQLQSQQERDLLATIIKEKTPLIRSALGTSEFTEGSLWQQLAASDDKVARICQRWGEISLRIKPDLANIVSSKLHQLLVNFPKNRVGERTVRHMINIASSMALGAWKLQSKGLKRQAYVLHSVRLVLEHDKPTFVHSFTITLNYLRSHEVLEERHILQVLKEEGISSTPSCFFASFRDCDTKFHHLYIEVPLQAPQASSTTSLLTRRTLENLSARILHSIERKPLSIFQPRNDEDALKRLIILAKEVENIKDPPQLALSFEQQTDEKLIFSLQMARPYLSGNPSFELIDQSEFSVEIEKRKKVEERSITKELLLASISLPKQAFIREDYSINLPKARLKVLRYLESTLGKVRDYNGGLIAKQQECFENILNKLGNIASYQEIQVEEVLFSLQPSVATSSFEIDQFSFFFEHLLQTYACKKSLLKSSKFSLKQEKNLLSFIATSHEKTALDALEEFIQELLANSATLVHGYLQKSQRHQLHALLLGSTHDDLKYCLKKFKKIATQSRLKIINHE